MFPSSALNTRLCRKRACRLSRRAYSCQASAKSMCSFSYAVQTVTRTQIPPIPVNFAVPVTTPREIQSPADIRLLIDTFYQKVRSDDVIGYIFNDIARVDWPKHLPVMYAFWEQIVLGTGDYTGNPMVIHQKLNELIPLQPEHFERWLTLFSQTVNELFAGEKAQLALSRATGIAAVMKTKLTSLPPSNPRNII
jgi:hemoglobin